MSSELWIRNPSHCIREAKQAGERNIVFDSGYAFKRKIDPIPFMKLYLGESADWQLMLIREHGAQLFTSESGEKHIGTFPVWDASVDSTSILEDWVANPVGEDQTACRDQNIHPESRPIYGQEHRVIIHNIPNTRMALGKTLLQMLRDIQLDYPEVKFFIHGLYSFMPLINLGFSAFDIEPRSAAAHKKVWLPNGREVKILETYHRHSQWVELLGYGRADMNEPATRCVFNIRAVRWAIENGTERLKFDTAHTAKQAKPDITTPANQYKPRENKSATKGLAVVKPGDKYECATCSLADKCKFYREGSVCTLPDSEMSELAKMFATTDTQTILGGLAKLTALAAQRTERAMAFEDDFGLDPEVTKMLKQTFEFGERYAKLNDPMLRATVNFNQNGGNQPPAIPGKVTITQLDPKSAAALAIEHYEKQGIPRNKITLEMVQVFMASLNEHAAIEGSVDESA